MAMNRTETIVFQKLSPPAWLLLSALCVVPALFLVCYHFLGLFNLKPAGQGNGLPEMEISEIYVYPIKSLRAVKLSSAIATAHGFAHDRTFMLLEKTPSTKPGYKVMSVSTHPHMTQFEQEVSLDPSSATENNRKITVRYLACGNASKQSSIDIPLVPSIDALSTLEVTMHNSPTTAYLMPKSYNDWFSTCFGFPVELIYLGSHRRSPRFNDLPSSPPPSLLKSLFFPKSSSPHTSQTLTFTDCAPYLFCTTASLSATSARLTPSTTPLSITKFRPNIVISGAPFPWQEDFWARLSIHSSRTGRDVGVALPHNCVRCSSINLDYETGKPGTGPEGQVLKKLQGDRRVDRGARWSPVFGRLAGPWVDERRDWYAKETSVKL
ncbi:hypothetical protein yc1106_02403 [Curvularia clavata]|uniref:MOSC domain-containing protein n=1 Tax=Curvularia clavata TaxID=95742 RepID=A0A9Q9DQW7_CURCL|nr:hypothetical protein yc1106_02403 [Curvularia clavata]